MGNLWLLLFLIEKIYSENICFDDWPSSQKIGLLNNEWSLHFK